MQQSRRKWLPCAILSLLALPLSAEAQTEKKLDGLQPVTHERLLKGTDDTSSWLMYGGSYQGWRFSPLKDITRQNVKKLAPAWILQTGAPGQLEASPVVADQGPLLNWPTERLRSTPRLENPPSTDR